MKLHSQVQKQVQWQVLRNTRQTIMFALASAACLYGLAQFGVAPAAAQKASCAAWTFSLDQEEEGKIWTASICASGDGGQSYLSLTCRGSHISLRYTPMVEGEFENQTRNFLFAEGGRQTQLSLAYEAMDGAFAGEVERSHVLVDMIRKGAELTVTETGGKVPAKHFSLKGAARALASLSWKCKAR